MILTIPDNISSSAVGKFECFPKQGQIPVGSVPVHQCDLIWDATENCTEAGLKHSITVKGDVILMSPPLCPYHHQTQAVADQFWMCRQQCLRSTLPTDIY